MGSTDESSSGNSHGGHALSATLRSMTEAVAGFTGGVCCVYFGLPFEVVKLRMQTSQQSGILYAGPIDCLRRTARDDSIRALWRGAGPGLASATIENTVLFTANDFVKRTLLNDPDDATLLQSAWCGGLAGFFTATAICPAEVIKCRLQFPTAAYRGPLDCLQNIVRTEGPFALMSGWIPILARDMPFNFVFLGGIELYCRGLIEFRRFWSDAADVRKRDLNALENLLAGGFAGATAWGFVFPMDVVKSRIQASSEHAGLRGAVETLRHDGAKVAFRGYSGAVLRGFPANAALYAGYTLTKDLLEAVSGSDDG